MNRLTAVTLAFMIALCPASYDSRRNDGDIFRGDPSCTSMVALTFDDGPHPTKTDEILQILGKYGVHATFFMVGENADMYPDIVARVIADGHEIGNHTYSHTYLSKKSTSYVESEILRTDNAILRAAEYRPHFLRPPGGILDDSVRKAAENEGLIIALWSIDTRDWARTKCDCIVSCVLDGVHGGDVILMHDYTGDCTHTAEALEIIIPALISRGYRFVTLSEMYCDAP